MTTLSILIPVYNAEDFLQETFESILSQPVSGDAYEVLVIDDGSTDHSRHIIHHYSSCFPKFKTVYQENRGVSRARNRGLKLASGEYVTFLDADDTYRENALVQMLETVRAGVPDMCFFDDIFATGVHKYDKNEFLSENYYDVYVWKTCIRLKLLEENRIRFVEGYILEDGVFLLEAILKSAVITTLKWDTVWYRENKKSLTRDYSDKKKNREMIASFVFVINKYRQLIFESKDNLPEKGYFHLMERKESFEFFMFFRMVRYGFSNKEIEEMLQKISFGPFVVFPGVHHDKLIYKVLLPVVKRQSLRAVFNTSYRFLRFRWGKM